MMHQKTTGGETQTTSGVRSPEFRLNQKDNPSSERLQRTRLQFWAWDAQWTFASTSVFPLFRCWVTRAFLVGRLTHFQALASDWVHLVFTSSKVRQVPGTQVLCDAANVSPDLIRAACCVFVCVWKKSGRTIFSSIFLVDPSVLIPNLPPTILCAFLPGEMGQLYRELPSECLAVAKGLPIKLTTPPT